MLHNSFVATLPYTTYDAKSKATSMAVLMSRVKMSSKVSRRRRRNRSARLLRGRGTPTASVAPPRSVPPYVRTLSTVGFLQSVDPSKHKGE